MAEQTKTAPTKEALREALTLSEEVLRNLEHADIPLSQAALKAARMARLMGNQALERLFQFEASGHPKDGMLPADVFQLALAAGRKTVYEDPRTKKRSDRVYVEGLAELEARRQAAETILARATTWMDQYAQTTVTQTTSRQIAPAVRPSTAT